jgi:hypothetical protein
MPTSSTAAVLTVITDHVDRYREEVARMADGLVADDRVAGFPEAHADLVSALYEAERALRGATRALQRAVKMDT